MHAGTRAYKVVAVYSAVRDSCIGKSFSALRSAADQSHKKPAIKILTNPISDLCSEALISELLANATEALMHRVGSKHPA